MEIFDSGGFLSGNKCTVSLATHVLATSKYYHFFNFHPKKNMGFVRIHKEVMVQRPECFFLSPQQNYSRIIRDKRKNNNKFWFLSLSTHSETMLEQKMIKKYFVKGHALSDKFYVFQSNVSKWGQIWRILWHSSALTDKH